MSRHFQCIALCAITSLAIGCSQAGDPKPDQDDTKSDRPNKSDRWGANDAPSLFSSSLEYRVEQLPQEGEATNIPWASTYWPTYEDSINYRWDGANSESPAAKYGRAFGIANLEDLVSKEFGVDDAARGKVCKETSECDSKAAETCAKRRDKTEGRCIPTWTGICHAWAPAAILLPEPKYPVTINGVTFKVMDIKGLITLLYNRSKSRFASSRCELRNDGTGTGVMVDANGRVTTAECRNTNPGTYHVLITNYLGVQKVSFVEDRIFDQQVWNQPLRGYRITHQEEVSKERANELIGVVTPAGGGGNQVINRTGTVKKGIWSATETVAVSAGSTLRVAMTGSGDADLYVRFGSAPTESSYDCRPYTDGSSTETCELTVPNGVTQALILVNGYADSSDYKLEIRTSAAVAANGYVFNPSAAKWYYVDLEVDYIGESSASADGPLSSSIDSYTHTDYYQYILEIDTAGKIIGGEWVEGSKKAHPDFVWLPTGHSDYAVASGKITYSQVKELLDRSQQPQVTTGGGGGGGGGGTGAVRTVTVSASPTAGQWNQFGPYQLAAGATLTATMTGTGDADLYVRKGAAPTESSYDCRPYKSGSNEQCTVVGPATVYAGVQGYAAASSVSLTITYTEGGGTAPPVAPPSTVTHLNVSGQVGHGESKVYSLAVLAGRPIVIRSTAPNDVDLYIQMGQAPTKEQYLARGYTTSGNETIRYTPTSNGTLFVLVDGYAASTFTLKTSDN